MEMHARVMILAAVSMALSARSSRAQGSTSTLDSVQVHKAIQVGLERREPVGARFETRHLLRSTGFVVFVQGPYDRIATAAAQAAKNYSAFTADSVQNQLATPLLTVRATPWSPKFVNGHWSVTPFATRVVLVPSTSSSSPVQPTIVAPFPTEWSNALGGAFQGQGIVAFFRIDQLPIGDFDIVVVTDSQEFRIAIGDNERKSIH